MPWRIYAALKFFLYTMAGSALMLVAILVLYFQGGTFDLLELQKLNLAPNLQIWLFLAFALAFAIKVPLFPFHTWLPDAHVAAPTGGSVILAGVLLKMGTYGFVRFCLPSFPAGHADVRAVDRARWRSSASSTARWWRWCRRTSSRWSPIPRWRTWAS